MNKTLIFFIGILFGAILGAFAVQQVDKRKEYIYVDIDKVISAITQEVEGNTDQETLNVKIKSLKDSFDNELTAYQQKHDVVILNSKPIRGGVDKTDYFLQQMKLRPSVSSLTKPTKSESIDFAGYIAKSESADTKLAPTVVDPDLEVIAPNLKSEVGFNTPTMAVLEQEGVDNSASETKASADALTPPSVLNAQLPVESSNLISAPVGSDESMDVNEPEIQKPVADDKLISEPVIKKAVSVEKTIDGLDSEIRAPTEAKTVSEEKMTDNSASEVKVATNSRQEPEKGALDMPSSMESLKVQKTKLPVESSNPISASVNSAESMALNPSAMQKPMKPVVPNNELIFDSVPERTASEERVIDSSASKRRSPADARKAFKEEMMNNSASEMRSSANFGQKSEKVALNTPSSMAMAESQRTNQRTKLPFESSNTISASVNSDESMTLNEPAIQKPVAPNNKLISEPALEKTASKERMIDSSASKMRAPADARTVFEEKMMNNAASEIRSSANFGQKSEKVALNTPLSIATSEFQRRDQRTKLPFESSNPISAPMNSAESMALNEPAIQKPVAPNNELISDSVPERTASEEEMIDSSASKRRSPADARKVSGEKMMNNSASDVRSSVKFRQEPEHVALNTPSSTTMPKFQGANQGTKPPTESDSSIFASVVSAEKPVLSNELISEPVLERTASGKETVDSLASEVRAPANARRVSEEKMADNLVPKGSAPAKFSQKSEKATLNDPLSMAVPKSHGTKPPTKSNSSISASVVSAKKPVLNNELISEPVPKRAASGKKMVDNSDSKVKASRSFRQKSQKWAEISAISEPFDAHDH